MKVLLLGVTGFIGSHVYKYLGGLGYECDYINQNEFNHEDWKKLDEKPDAVVNCAWVRESDLQSHKHIEFAEWVINFYNECKNRGIRVINIGSSSEYGPKFAAMKEDMVCEPISAYGIGKLMVTLWAKRLGYNTLRLFSPFGEGGKNFASIFEKSDKYGNSHDTRDYYPVELVCHAVERLLHAHHIYGEIINVCSGIPRSNIEVIGDIGSTKRIKLGNNVDKRWNKYPQRQYEPYTWYGDTDKMHRLLNI